MEDLLEKTKQAVEKYHSKQAGEKMKATKTILSAVLACRNFITEAEREQQGDSQQLARLSEVLSALPMFQNMASETNNTAEGDTKKLVGEHLETIQRDLENSLKEMQVGKKKKIQDWVKSHPVLGKLKKTAAAKDLPAGAYVLLFRRSASLPPKQRKGSKRDPRENKNDNNAIAVLTIIETPTAEVEQGHATEQHEVAVEENVLNEEAMAADNAEQTSAESSPESSNESSPEASSDDQEAALADDDNAAPEQEESDAEANSEDNVDAADELDDVELAPEDDEQSAESNESDASAEQNADVASEKAGEGTEEASSEQDAGAQGEQSLAQPKKPTEKVPPDLVVRPAPDGKVFTRFRPKEFSDDSRVYRMFRGGPPLVGACIIADGKLISTIGVLPQPQEGRDQLRLLLSISKDAVGKPGRDFVESNEVLNELFQLSKSRGIHKEAYVLLFQEEQPKEPEQAQTSAEPAADNMEPSKESPAVDEASASEEAPTSDEAPAEESGEPEEGAVDPSAESTEETSTPEPAQPKESAPSQQEQDSAPEKSMEPPKLELVSKTTEDGRIITRYRSFDFNDMRSLYENFKKRPAVVGAAIIRERELIKVLGRVPAADGAKQLDVLLGASRQVLEKPSLEFISANPILNSLYELANGDFRQKDYNVVLFKDQSGRPEILSLPDRRGFNQVKTPLSEFRIAKFVHDRFKSESALVGASVIGETGPAAPPPRVESKHGKDKDRDRNRQDNNFRSRGPSRSSSVVAAFGKTPLKQNVLLSAEILKRLGVDLSIL